MRKTILILACALLAACGAKQQQTAAPTAAVAAPQTTNTGSALPQALKDALPPASPPKNAAVGLGVPFGAPQNALTGKVVETMNSGGYTYVRVGDKWAAVRETKLKKGDNVTIAAQMVMDDFESKTLNRKFDHIILGTLVNGAAAPAPAPMASSADATEHMKAAAPAGDVKVDRAKDGKTVAEVWAQKKDLSDKPVTVRGKVVKFLPEIMGKNWLHLRDGSGSREKGDDDITVTTTEMVKVGDVITVVGTLRVDKDFGAGYRYPVIIEDAKVQP